MGFTLLIEIKQFVRLLKYCLDVKVTAHPLLPQLCSNYRPLIWGISYNTKGAPITSSSYRCVSMSSPGPTLQSAQGGHKTNQEWILAYKSHFPQEFCKIQIRKKLCHSCISHVHQTLLPYFFPFLQVNGVPQGLWVSF